MIQDSNPRDRSEIVKRSSLYQEFLAEREEILKHKWLESERLARTSGLKRPCLIGFATIGNVGESGANEWGVNNI